MALLAENASSESNSSHGAFYSSFEADSNSSYHNAIDGKIGVDAGDIKTFEK